MSNLDEAMYRHTVAQRDSAWREVEYWQRQCDSLRKKLQQLINLQINPQIQKPVMLADKESYEAGRVKGQQEAADEQREQCAQLVEAMGMQGYGTLAIAAAIRKEKS